VTANPPWLSREILGASGRLRGNETVAGRKRILILAVAPVLAASPAWAQREPMGVRSWDEPWQQIVAGSEPQGPAQPDAQKQGAPAEEPGDEVEAAPRVLFGSQGQWLIMGSSTGFGLSSEKFSQSSAKFFDANVAPWTRTKPRATGPISIRATACGSNFLCRS
jgi:hypothetical protein